MSDLKFHIAHGNALDVLKGMPDNFVHCVVTSPPYLGLRSYDADKVKWPDGWVGCLGNEPDHHMYIHHLKLIFSEVYRVLRDDGTLWLNIGDSFNAGRSGGHPGGKKQWKDGRYQKQSGLNLPGLSAKNLVGVPWRLAFALQESGWHLRCDCIWHKTAVMPTSAKDRPTIAHEYMFLMAKSLDYFYDAAAIGTPITNPGKPRQFGKKGNLDRQDQDRVYDPKESRAWANMRNIIEKDQDLSPYLWDWLLESMPENQELQYLYDKWLSLINEDRSVMKVSNTGKFKGPHFALMPTELAEIGVKAGTSKQCCADCYSPWELVEVKVTENLKPTDSITRKNVKLTPKDSAIVKYIEENDGDYRISTKGDKHHHTWTNEVIKGGRETEFKEKGYSLMYWGIPNQTQWEPTCKCETDKVKPAIVLDPFGGVSTTGVAALRNDRYYIGIEISEKYIDMGKKRLYNVDPMFVQEVEQIEKLK